MHKNVSVPLVGVAKEQGGTAEHKNREGFLEIWPARGFGLYKNREGLRRHKNREGIAKGFV